MVKAATAKRRYRIQQQQIQHASQKNIYHQQQQHQQQQHEDEVGALHDEADIMSFRSIATQRFLFNQELIENITDKWVHIDSITKPKAFNNFQTTKKTLDAVKSDELYFGNLELMKQKLNKIEDDVATLEKSKDEGFKDEYSTKIKFLESTISSLNSSYITQEPIPTDEIESQFSTQVNKTIKSSHYTIRSIPKLRIDTSEAPANYWDEIAKTKAEAAAAAELAHQQEQQRLQKQQLQEQQLQEQQQQQQLQQQQQQQQQFQSQQQLHQQQGQQPLVIAGGYDLHSHNPNPQDLGYSQTGFGAEDINIIDDVGFGLHSTLDDQDFLSQIDHSME